MLLPHHLVVIECNNMLRVILDHAACIVILIGPLTGCIDLYMDILRISRVGAANIQHKIKVGRDIAHRILRTTGK